MQKQHPKGVLEVSPKGGGYLKCNFETVFHMDSQAFHQLTSALSPYLEERCTHMGHRFSTVLLN